MKQEKKKMTQKPMTEEELGRITDTIAECYGPSIAYTQTERISLLARVATRLLSEVQRMRRQRGETSPSLTRDVGVATQSG